MEETYETENTQTEAVVPAPMGGGIVLTLTQPESVPALGIKWVVEGIVYALVGILTHKLVGAVSDRISGNEEELDNVTQFRTAGE